MGKQFNLEDFLWPDARLAEGARLLAVKCGYIKEIDLPPPIISDDWPGLRTKDDLSQWFIQLGEQLTVDISALNVSYDALDQSFRSIGPAIVSMPGYAHIDSSPQPDDSSIIGRSYLLILKNSVKGLEVLDLNGNKKFLPRESVQYEFCEPIETQWHLDIQNAIACMNLALEKQTEAERILLRDRKGSETIAGIWILKLRYDANIWQKIRYERIVPALTMWITSYVFVQTFFILSWFIIGSSALQGNLNWEILFQWGLILLSSIPFSMWQTYCENLLAIRTGIFFKQRLLLGTQRLEQDEIRHMGSGQFVGHVASLEFAEAKAVDDALAVITSSIDILAAMIILGLGIGGWFHSFLLLIWCIIIVILTWIYFRIDQEWHDLFQEMANQSVEKMLAQQTRLAQEDRSHWHDEDDDMLVRYIQISTRRSLYESVLSSLSKGWMVPGIIGVAIPIVTKPELTASAMAISMGGILLAYHGIGAFTIGLDNVVISLTGLLKANMLFKASGKPKLRAAMPITQKNIPENGNVLLARDISFRYRPNGRVVLNKCNLQIQKGDRILLEGSSGGGKTTLASVLATLRKPEAGLLLLWDFDLKTVGEDLWHQRVVLVPQFHENHIFSESLAFNLLMGRRWPPTEEDLLQAEAICRELGLGALLNRMPTGIHQIVGERGWRLSHGERSRIYIARALLQNADLVILDESFGSLDPENLFQAMQCVTNHAPTLMVIAHP